MSTSRLRMAWDDDRIDPPLSRERLDVAGVRRKLTRRETEIVELLVDDLTDKEIARELGITHRTVRTHLERIYRKQRVRSRTGAVAAWLTTKPRR